MIFKIHCFFYYKRPFISFIRINKLENFNKNKTQMTSTQIKNKTQMTSTGRINNYVLFETIGEGGFSEVKKGTMPNGKDVAVKIMKDNLSGKELELVANETKAMNSIPNHPNVLNILGSGGDA